MTTTLCPCCGQARPAIADAEQLFDLMSRERRNVYRGRDGNWYLEKGGGPISQWAITALLNAGRIRNTYSDTPSVGYTAGPTIDMAATLEYRRGKKRKDWRIVYEDGSTGALRR